MSQREFGKGNFAKTRQLLLYLGEIPIARKNHTNFPIFHQLLIFCNGNNRRLYFMLPIRPDSTNGVIFPSVYMLVGKIEKLKSR